MQVLNTVINTLINTFIFVCVLRLNKLSLKTT